MLVDLHIHSSASDGSFDTKSILAEGEAKGIEVIAITDHDTVEGAKELPVFLEKVVALPGVEISAEFPGTLHILGYGIDTGCERLVTALNEVQRFREERNLRMIQKMNQMGFEISLEELAEVAGDGPVGRPHFAQLMLRKGLVSSIGEAFERYLRKGALFYEEKERLAPRKAIELIREANGIPVLAHPYQTGLSGDELDRLVSKLVEWGLEGIEVFYPRHTKTMVEEYLRLSQKYGLLITAGSDFHGLNKPGASLGMEIPYLFLRQFLCQLMGRYEHGKAGGYSR